MKAGLNIKAPYVTPIWHPWSLNRFDPENESFTSYFEKNGLPSAQLMAIEEDKDGNLWISSINGLSKIEKR